MEAKNTQHTQEIHTLSTQLTAAKDELQEYEAGKLLVGVKIEIEGGFTPEEIQKIRKELEDEKGKLAEERKSLTEKAENLAAIVVDKAAQVEDLQRLLASAKTQETTLRSELASLQSDKSACDMTNKRLKEELSACEEQLKAQRQLTTSIDHDLQSTLKTLNSHKNEIDSLSKRLQETEKAKSTLQGVLDKTREDLTAKTKSVDTVKQQLQSVMQNRKLNAEMTFRLVQEGNAVLGLQTQNSTEMLGFEEVMDGLKAHNSRLKTVQNELDTGLNKVIEKFGGASKPSTDLSTAGGKLVQLMEVSLTQLNELKDAAANSERLYKESQQAISDLQKLVEELNHSAESYAKSADLKEKSNLEMMEKLSLREEEIQKMMKIAIEKSELEAIVKTLQEKNKDVAGRLQTERETQQALQEENQSLKALLEKAVSEAKDKGDTGVLLKADMDQLSAELDAMRLSLATANEQVMNLEESKQRLTEAIEQMQETETALGAANSDLSQHLSELEVALDSKETQLHTQNDTIAQLTSTCDQLRAAILAKESELAATATQLEGQLKTTEAVKEEAKQLLSKVAGQVTLSENLIDRRLISTFLFNYLNPRNSERLRKEMLESMVNVLGLEESQRSALGLGPETGLLADFASYISKED